MALLLAALPGQAQAAGTCGTGSWQSGSLEIHHIDIGQGDSTLIVSPSGKSLLFDAGETSWNSSAKAHVIGPYIEGVLGCKSLDYVVLSHFHVDHAGYVGYGGLWNLVEAQGFTVGTTLVRDYNSYLGDTSGTFTNWKAYLEGAGQAKLHPVTAVEGTGQVDLGPGVTFNLVTADGNGAILAGDFHGDASPPSENDYSISAVLSFGKFDEWIGGDLDGEYEVSGFGYSYHDIESSAAREAGDVDVYRANHHGSSHSSNATFLSQLDPEVSIISVGSGNTYGHPDQTVMNRLLATSTVYLTERGNLGTDIGSGIVAGTIVIKTSDGLTYTVNGIPYAATEPARLDHDGDGYFAEADPDDNNPAVKPASNGGCDPNYEMCSAALSSCQVTTGQVVINEVLPAPSNNGTEWVELYNTTPDTLNIGSCILDDIPAGSPAYQIPASTFIPAHGFWTLDRTSYFNNDGDSVRFLKEDGSTLLDSFTYGKTNNDLSWIRLPDGGAWAASPTASTTKGGSNTIPFYPIVTASRPFDENPTSESSVRFTVTFSKAVTGVNTTAPFANFRVSTTGLTGSRISSVAGSGTAYTITVSTGSGNGTLRLDVVDDDSIKDASNHPLGGTGAGNGSFTTGEAYTVTQGARITIGTQSLGSYTIPSSPSTIVSQPNTVDGPVRVTSTGGRNLFTSERVIAGSSFNEVMGYPTNQLTTEYWFPWYDNNSMTTWLLVGNASSTQAAAVDIYIGGIKRGSYSIPIGGRVTPRFNITPTGPVKVISTNGAKIFTSERTQYGPNNAFNEVMGYPASQFATDYWFPWYDNVSMTTWVLVGNPSTTSSAAVDIYIGGTKTGSYNIPRGGNVTPRFNITPTGPVRVVSTNGVKIFASERTIAGDSFNEVMGYPASQFTTEYWYPWYDNVDMATWVLVGNPTGSTAKVDIYVGGVKQASYSIPAGGRITPRFASLNTGPVRVVSTNGVKIFTSERVSYSASFNEFMGYPANQLTTEYWFPWYDSSSMTTDIIVGVP